MDNEMRSSGLLNFTLPCIPTPLPEVYCLNFLRSNDKCFWSESENVHYLNDIIYHKQNVCINIRKIFILWKIN